MNIVVKTGQFQGTLVPGNPEATILELLRRLEILEQDILLQSQLAQAELDLKVDTSALTEQAFK